MLLETYVGELIFLMRSVTSISVLNVSRILLHLIQTIVLPKSGHLDEVSHMDVALIDSILRHPPINLGYTIIRTTFSIPNLVTRSLPYGHFIILIL